MRVPHRESHFVIRDGTLANGSSVVVQFLLELLISQG